MMLIACFALLLISQSTFSEVITGINLNPSCTGSLSITHYHTKTELHKINKTVLNILITRNTRVVVKQTGNCCHHVFNRRNCRGEVVLAENNEGRQIAPNKHTGSLSVVRFDVKDVGETLCSEVSTRHTKKLCKEFKEMLANNVEKGKLAIEKENETITVEKEKETGTIEKENETITVEKEKETGTIEKENETVTIEKETENESIPLAEFHKVSIQGDLYNITNVDNETVIIIRDVEQRRMGSDASTLARSGAVFMFTVIVNLFYF